ncbi:MAG: type II secretion system protein GspN [Proteobacteria bacterium]|nr:type II secretion system protein GspN [Pseudomonadota bacterium]
MNRKSVLRLSGYLIWFLLLTLLFAFVNFPRDNLTSWVNGRLSLWTDEIVRCREASLAIPFSLRLKDVTLDPGANPVVIGDAVISPSLSSFLTGGKGASVRISGIWGISKIKARSGRGGWKFELTSLEADLGRAPLPETLPYRVAGAATVLGTLQGEGESAQTLTGEGEIRGEGIEISGSLLEAVDLSPLKFSGVDLVFTVDKGVLSIGENRFLGDFTGEMRGTMALNPGRLQDSRLNMTLQVRPDSRIREKVLPLLSMAGARPGPDGGTTWRIRGTLDRPSISR